jgi:hypothetical protein
VLWPAIPLGQRSRGSLHSSTRTFDPISELAGAEGFLAASANLLGSGNFARRSLSILTSMTGSLRSTTPENARLPR